MCKLIYPWGRKNASPNLSKLITGFYSRFLSEWVLVISIVANILQQKFIANNLQVKKNTEHADNAVIPKSIQTRHNI